MSLGETIGARGFITRSAWFGHLQFVSKIVKNILLGWFLILGMVVYTILSGVKTLVNR